MAINLRKATNNLRKLTLNLRDFASSTEKGSFVVGLDIDQEYITAVQLKKTHEGFRLAHFGSCPTPSGSIENGLIVNSEQISKSIKELFTAQQFNSKRVISALWGPRVLVHLAVVPPMSKAQMKEALKQEVSHYVLFAGVETVSDMCNLEEVIEQGVKKNRVLMGIADKEMVNSYLKVIKDAGLDLVGLDISSLSVIRAAYPGYLKISSNETVVLAIIEHQNTNLCVLKAGILSYR